MASGPSQRPAGLWEEGGPELPPCGGRLCQEGAGLPAEGPQGSARGPRSAVPASGGPGPQGPRELWGCPAGERRHSSLHREPQVGLWPGAQCRGASLRGVPGEGVLEAGLEAWEAGVAPSPGRSLTPPPMPVFQLP